MSLLLAVVAKLVAEAFGVKDAITVADFVVVSVVGALIPTAVVLGITVAIAALGVRREWDIDNVSVPVVTAAGDVVTLPSLFLATYLVTDVAELGDELHRGAVHHRRARAAGHRRALGDCRCCAGSCASRCRSSCWRGS